jgi:hypothetical protein
MMRAKSVFPRHNTVKAAVLADLLEGQELTHFDCWIKHASGRLSHHVWDLIHQHGWPIECRGHTVECSDGRTTAIGMYWLPAEGHVASADIERAFIRCTRNARAALRLKAKNNRRSA